MRIIGGALKGLRLAAVGRGDPAARLRPTADRVREAIFNVLGGGAFEVEIEGAEVLDLFAGTGALGLEALSRGAAHATFVEQGRKALALLAENIARARMGDRATVLRRDATRPFPWARPPATLVFLDPPYGKGLGARALGAALASGAIAPGAVVVWEESGPQEPPQGFTLLDRRRWGEAHVTFLRRNPA
ncbi:16S rRNA (guanine966-N2)-methyltransferase [Meinhardsimonia xiamenensis]|jgi:16S rRNA (guanine966-N2)-methyltransferase|uniref:16S rRNA (Guanine966-N2)-methyltransferase n=1 Tax=Meinhardsimonia xiamenensis TaxID=990712 RepID=A0A1G8XVQ8_9RHOB|nr:16S rRNA (guanine(966)-N(2))-methyltransferase RsmD [Meinhardsimonia xiamenensis]PRX37066.1 16S rRNA (guanine966-N2)-methyltransferase [Meinhardsimonia xiamenensis]SDJ94712.1 16S rRNA (guanine966-N2)-methyltransferase [Meinhardsimonia xiamenensis]